MSDSQRPQPPVGIELRRVLVRCGWLTLAVAAVFPLVAYVMYRRHEESGLWAAAVAAGVCWLGATIALVLTWWLQGPRTGSQGVLLGMLFRTGLPLLAAMGLAARGGPLAEAGVLGAVLVFYLVTLVVETLLVLPLIRGTAGPKRTS